ncbi:6-O-methylguanine DNA methyltransferase [Pseudomonas aeruginosa]|nr:6-O-methylguanine DNA methyltransferase [Pseudomonas paraeruginosa]MCO3059688.1 6-O-methylguanine DNA methyltransferase [Pseudomonas aeruginosa]MCO3132262.1 6-O-methylguanine DNA methyltransferase [Pseudomonas aeruginosa]MCO3160115.1 6-O-methylguanine DNA methyltransferase [Pseudomonas aeruginosa]RTT28324.1 6-O-methylguanine DNA methyltransferase [Pseudomonas paraeruginosa]
MSQAVRRRVPLPPRKEAVGNSSARTGVLALEGRTSLRASSAATGEPP